MFFYPLKDDLTVDIRILTKIIEEKCPSVILVMNYFGLSPTQESINYIKSQHKDILIIEDCTHILWDLELYHNPNVDYYVASIKKWIEINNGAKLNSIYK